jgi:hypothetical protein
MTDQPDIDGLIDREPSAQEREELESLMQRLRRRPVPRARFRGELRRRLLAAAEQQPSQPQRLRLLTAAYAGSGVVLLAIAALGVAGAGPLAAS